MKQAFPRETWRSKLAMVLILGIPFEIMVGGMVFSEGARDVCAEHGVVMEIVEQRYRTTYVLLDNGSILDLYTPVVAPGDELCVRRETIVVPSLWNKMMHPEQ